MTQTLTAVDYAPSISAMAERIRRGNLPKITLTHEFVTGIKEAWRDDRGRDDCRVIMDAFPGDFPLFGERQAI